MTLSAPRFTAALALVLACLALPAQAQLFPPRATVHDELFYILTFRCPYPTANAEPLVIRQARRTVVEIQMVGTVCFTGNDDEVEFAIPLGRLPKGDHDLEIYTFFETDGASGPFGGPPIVRRIRVREETPVRVSGLWFDPAAPQQGFNILLAPNGEMVVNWFTYAPGGDPVWLVGQAMPDGLEGSFQMALASGGRFAQGGGSPELTPFGTLDLDFTSCGRATARWRSTVPGFGNRNLELIQLSSAEGLGNCEPEAITRWRGWR